MDVPARSRGARGPGRPALGPAGHCGLHGRKGSGMAKRIDLSALAKRPDGESSAVVAAHLALVLAPLYLSAYLGPSWRWLLSWAWCGVLMNGVLNLMHECAHVHLFRRRGFSDFVGRWIVGPLLLADFEGY